MAEQIKVAREGAVEIISFCNPPMNFISNVMLKEFREELLRLRDDDSVRVLVLTGGMKDSFVTHYDVSELVEYSKSAPRPPAALNNTISGLVCGMLRKAHRHAWLEKFIIKLFSTRPPAEQGIFYWARCMDILDTMPKPIIAAISGMSLGGGCEISLCCDFRFMARHPNNLYRIGLPEVLVGIIPGGTGTPPRLPRIVGEAKALEMLMTGTLYTPDEAEAMGLIHKALNPDELMPTVMELAGRLSRGAPIALASIRENVRFGSRLAWPQARVVDMAVTNRAIFSNDAIKGMERYVQKVAQHDTFDLQVVLDEAKDLLEGREVHYEGK